MRQFDFSDRLMDHVAVHYRFINLRLRTIAFSYRLFSFVIIDLIVAAKKLDEFLKIFIMEIDAK